MKGTKLRVGLMLLAALLLLAGCGKTNPSVLQLPEGTASTQGGDQSTPAPLKALGIGPAGWARRPYRRAPCSPSC